MAITVNFYTFSKKTNSTKQPTGTAALSASCLLKDATSIITPVFQIRTSDPTTYNYCYCRAFHRYYFISDITWNKGYWEIRCKCDVLATYKTTIGSTNGYVVRSATRSNGEIIDSLWPTTADTTVNAVTPSNTSTFTGATTFDAGYYVIGLKGNNATSENGVIYYQLTPQKFKTLIDNFYAVYADSSNTTWWGSSLVKGFINSVAHLDDYICSCRWYPVTFFVDTDPPNPDYPDVGPGYPIYLGTWDSGVKAPRVIADPTYTVYYENIPKHPQVSYGAYTKIYPYTHYELVDPLIGTITLNPVVMKNDTSVTCDLTFDHTSGQIRYKVSGANTSYPFYTTYLEGSVNINLSGMEVNVGGIAAGIGQTVANIAKDGWVGIAKGIANTIDNIMPQPGHNQISGGLVAMKNYAPFIRCCFKQIVDRDTTNKGLPYCKWNNPATLTGYMEIDNPHVEVAGTAQEIDQINGYLNSGFYYE